MLVLLVVVLRTSTSTIAILVLHSTTITYLISIIRVSFH